MRLDPIIKGVISQCNNQLHMAFRSQYILIIQTRLVPTPIKILPNFTGFITERFVDQYPLVNLVIKCLMNTAVMRHKPNLQSKSASHWKTIGAQHLKHPIFKCYVTHPKDFSETALFGNTMVVFVFKEKVTFECCNRAIRITFTCIITIN